MTYNQWMSEVDAEVHRLTGFCQDDFEDWLSRDAYDDGVPPEEAARECLRRDPIGSQLLRLYESEE